MFFITKSINLMSRFSKYLQDTAGELRHVKWPSQRQAMIYVALVVGVSAIVSLFVAGFDYVFTNLLNIVI